MSRRIEITLETRGVSARATLLDDLAPRTSAAVWDSLPQAGDAWHAKYASNEVYALVPPLTPAPVGRENSTLTPITGDLVYFDFPADQIPPAMRADLGLADAGHFVDLAIFYGRNNLLLDPSSGFVPGNVFATIDENLDAMVAACVDVWRNGFAGERLRFARVD